MLIVGSNLKQLISQTKIIENYNNNFDDNCIKLSLDNTIISPIPDKEIIYGDELEFKNYYKKTTLKNSEYLVLNPGDSYLCCSTEIVKMPMGYFGLLQTKGSLARLFVTIHCCDSQIDGGFNGKITFEIVNFSKSVIKIEPGSFIGSLYIIKTSTNTAKPYSGKYMDANEPTIQK